MGTASYVEKQSVYTVTRQQGTRPVLEHLVMELTERCNNNCIHCCIRQSRDDGRRPQKELSTNEICDILREAALLGAITVRFSGGEPLLRDDFEEIYLCARRLGMMVAIFTNATRVTPRLAKLFARIPPLEKIEVTVFGMKRETCEEVTRAQGSYDAACNGIRLLVKHRVPFYVRGTVLPPNKDELDEFEAWAAALPSMDGAPQLAMFLDLHCRRDSARNRLIRSVRLSPEEGLAVLTRKGDIYIKEIIALAARLRIARDDRLFRCSAGIMGLCVDAFGTLQPCVMLRHPACVYDLKKGSIEDAVRNFFPVLRKRKASNPEYLTRCARCFLRGFCDQCPAKAWAAYGTLDTPVDYFCDVAHVHAKHAGLLKGEERAWEIEDWAGRIRQLACVEGVNGKNTRHRTEPCQKEQRHV